MPRSSWNKGTKCNGYAGGGGTISTTEFREASWRHALAQKQQGEPQPAVTRDKGQVVKTESILKTVRAPHTSEVANVQRGPKERTVVQRKLKALANPGGVPKEEMLWADLCVRKGSSGRTVWHG